MLNKLNLNKKNIICVRYDSQNDKKLIEFRIKKGKNKGKYRVIFQKYRGCWKPESKPILIN